MQEITTSREKILKKVRNALIKKTPDTLKEIDLETTVFANSGESHEITFAHNFTALTGKFIYAENPKELGAILKEFLNENKIEKVFSSEEKITGILTNSGISFSDDTSTLTDYTVCITGCEFLVARTGSIMISSKEQGRKAPAFPDVHIVIAYTSQLVYDIKDALSGIKEKYKEKIPSLVSLITGPSRTADIEKTLIIGAHGPKEIYVFLTEDK